MAHNNQTTGQAFLEACHTMHHLMNSCKLWIDITMQIPTEVIRLEKGCLRSIRLARLRPVTHEATEDSAVQMVLLPQSFECVKPLGINHPQWRLIIYSWLGPEKTRQLKAELNQRFGLSNCTFMLVKGQTCTTM